MDPAPSFAPLAAKLVAKAEEIRLADGAKGGLAGVMAWLMASLLMMLACLCEALDKRAAADAARLLAAPAPRPAKAGAVLTARHASSGERRAPRLSPAPEIDATAPNQADASSGIGQGPIPVGPRLAWSRDPGPVQAVHAPPWRRSREMRLSRNAHARPFRYDIVM